MGFKDYIKKKKEQLQTNIAQERAIRSRERAVNRLESQRLRLEEQKQMAKIRSDRRIKQYKERINTPKPSYSSGGGLFNDSSLSPFGPKPKPKPRTQRKRTKRKSQKRKKRK